MNMPPLSHVIELIAYGRLASSSSPNRLSSSWATLSPMS